MNGVHAAGRQWTVLLVDDDNALRYALRRSLEHLGFRVLEAADGAGALAQAHAADAVVLDVVLPDGDGVGVCERLRDKGPADLVVIHYSGIAIADADKVAGLRAGADAYLVKPVDVSVLAANLEAQLRKRDAFRRLADELDATRDAELKARDLFLAVLGHDMRGPLDAMMMSSTLLLRLEEMPALATRAAARAMSSGQRIKEMLDDLHDFAQVRVGDGLSVHPTPVDLSDLVQSTLDEFSVTMPESILQLDVRAQAIGSWDRGKLIRLLMNLLRNAAQHGDRSRPVQVSIDCQGSTAILEVRNHGEPVAPELLPHVFERLVRSSSARTATHNLGLGLFICRQIAEAHGGHIWIRSDPSGTTVTVELPLMASQSASQSVSQSASRPASTTEES